MYDIIIIGAGSGGLNIAGFMARVGLRILLIDKTDANIGGDCLNTGCIPSKSLIHIARTIAESKKVAAYGMTFTGEVDIISVMKEVTSKIETIRTHENAEHFRSLGIEVVLGHASFVSHNEVMVENVRYKGKKIIIATGSSPRELKLEGIESAHVVTNESIFKITTLPKKLVVVGVGPIGIELGQAFCMLGVDVTFVSNESRILPREQALYAEVIHAAIVEQGGKFLYAKNLVRIGHGDTLFVKDIVTNEESTISFDMMLVAVGREIHLESLALEKANVDVENGKIIVNDYLQTTNKDIYVSGDVTGGYQFTHAAELHAKVILNNFFNPFFKKKLTYDTFSWVTYSTPELATFGQSEALLLKKGIQFEKVTTTHTDDDRAITEGSTNGLSEVYIDTKTKRILGGTMVAHNAGELVQEFIFAMEAKIPSTKFLDKIYPYPTATRVNKTLLSGYFAKRLTKRATKLLRVLYSLA